MLVSSRSVFMVLSPVIAEILSTRGTGACTALPKNELPDPPLARGCLQMSAATPLRLGIGLNVPGGRPQAGITGKLLYIAQAGAGFADLSGRTDHEAAPAPTAMSSPPPARA